MWIFPHEIQRLEQDETQPKQEWVFYVLMWFASRYIKCNNFFELNLSSYLIFQLSEIYSQTWFEFHLLSLHPPLPLNDMNPLRDLQKDLLSASDTVMIRYVRLLVLALLSDGWSTEDMVNFIRNLFSCFFKFNFRINFLLIKSPGFSLANHMIWEIIFRFDIFLEAIICLKKPWKNELLHLKIFVFAKFFFLVISFVGFLRGQVKT